MRFRILLSPLLILFLVISTLSQRALGTTWVVNSSGDRHDVVAGDGVCGDPLSPDSTCSVRAAIEESNSNSEPDTVLVHYSISPIRLTLGELTVSDNGTVIRGSGGSAIIDGAGQPTGSSILAIISRGNRIGGLTIRRSPSHGIIIESDSNLIGGTGSGDGLTVVGAGFDDPLACGILLRGTGATGNMIEGNFVGMLRTGGIVIPNARGIGITGGAHGNRIGGTSAAARNIISGNTADGIVIENDAHGNLIIGNYIGPDQSGIKGPGNGGNGVTVNSGSYENIVGGIGLASRNYICGNRADGIKLSGAGSESNRILGNSIGMDITGYVAMGNRGNGIAIERASARNEIGSSDSGTINIISGNLGHGISITGAGSDGTIILGNYIGFDSSGYGPIGNGDLFAAGIYVGESVRGTVIGGSSEVERNYFAYNLLGGIYLDGADETLIRGNYIGVSVFSLSGGYNGNGVVLRNGAAGNQIGGSQPGEGNTISANLMDEFPFGAGVLMIDHGTSENKVFGNMIGVDASGSRRMPNASAGVVICEGASENQIGGPNPGEGNIISGNGYATNLVSIGRGVHLYGEGTSNNIISGNLIGVGSDSLSPIPNLGNGIGLYFGAQDNVIGGETEADGNLIAANRSHGVYLQSPDTKGNLIRHNRVRENDSLGIAVRQLAQAQVQPPVLMSYVAGEVRGTAAPLMEVDLYLVAEDPSHAGEGATWLASGMADGNGELVIPIPAQASDAKVTAIGTDIDRNSSAFAVNLALDQTTDVGDLEILRPRTFELEQNYPNPFNPSTTIEFTLPVSSRVTLTVYNLLGEEVIKLRNDILPAGRQTVIWDGKDSQGASVASGLYWYRLEAADYQATRKMLLLK